MRMAVVLYKALTLKVQPYPFRVLKHQILKQILVLIRI